MENVHRNAKKSAYKTYIHQYSGNLQNPFSRLCRYHKIIGDSPRTGAIINNRATFGVMCAAFAVYSAVVYTSGTDTPHLEPISDKARAGQRVFQQYNCIACHQFYGLGGYMGPDLTNVISNRGPALARAFIAGGTASMPNFDLDDAEIDALIDYLTFVDATGRYPPANYSVSWFGTVTQEDDPQ